ncbi:hypothetical protein H4219_006470, partial [Mycoemilia scoparia]
MFPLDPTKGGGSSKGGEDSGAATSSGIEPIEHQKLSAKEAIRIQHQQKKTQTSVVAGAPTIDTRISNDGGGFMYSRPSSISTTVVVSPSSNNNSGGYGAKLPLNSYYSAHNLAAHVNPTNSSGSGPTKMGVGTIPLHAVPRRSSLQIEEIMRDRSISRRKSKNIDLEKRNSRNGAPINNGDDVNHLNSSEVRSSLVLKSRRD